MIQAGDTIRNPATGGRIVVHQTAAHTNGEAVVIETFVGPGGRLDIPLHPSQEERLQVLRGRVGVRIGRTTRIAGPGARVTVPPGSARRLWNAGDGVAQVVCEIRPALQFETRLESIVAAS